MKFFRFTDQTGWQDKIFERVFRDRILRREQLLPFGFIRKGNGFSYCTQLLQDRFNLILEIDANGFAHAQVQGTGDRQDNEFLLAQKTPSSFTGKKLRKEYEEELWHIAERCFEPDAFKNDMTLRVIEHVKTTYGDALEYLWRNFPGNAIVRTGAKGKWYGAFLTVARRKLSGDSGEKVEILNLRVHPAELETIVDGASRFPGYHMNKKHWVSLCLDGTVPFDELAQRIGTSHRLALK